MVAKYTGPVGGLVWLEYSRLLCSVWSITTHHQPVCGWWVWLLIGLSVVLAVGSRPVPFRTRKLSPPALMVLHLGGCGRVGHRRHHNIMFGSINQPPFGRVVWLMLPFRIQRGGYRPVVPLCGHDLCPFSGWARSWPTLLWVGFVRTDASKEVNRNYRGKTELQ